MFRKRGTPAFLELLRGGPGSAPSSPGHGSGRAVMVDPKPVVRVMPVARPAGSGSVTASLPKPLPVYQPSGVPAPASSISGHADASTVRGGGSDGGAAEGGGGGGTGVAGLPRIWLYAAAAGVVVLSLVWVAAFKVGEATGRRDGDDKVRRLVQGEPGGGAKQAGAGAVADPLVVPTKPPAASPTQPSTGSAEPPRVSDAPPATKPLPQSGSAVLGFQQGLNYLVVATLRKADADEAAKYLSGQGLPMLILPERGIDPASPQANNASWEVLVLNGYSSPLSATQAERTDLETKVKSLGRRWKAENRKAPTDFAQVFWKRFRGQ